MQRIVQTKWTFLSGVAVLENRVAALECEVEVLKLQLQNVMKIMTEHDFQVGFGACSSGASN